MAALALPRLPELALEGMDLPADGVLSWFSVSYSEAISAPGKD